MSSGAPALEGIRVLELGGELSNYCGKLFAELGADVVLIEPPGGSDLRSQPPYADDEEGVEQSLGFFYRNTSKRSAVIDIESPSGAEVVRKLAATADMVLEDRPPGYLASVGLDPARLIEENPALVVTSITPFGQEGPYAQFAHADIVCMALGGMLWMGGYDDGPPVRAVGDQAYMAGSLFGAVSAMVALTHAEIRGEGQHVDVSVQEAVALGLENAAQYYDLECRIRRRFGGTQREAGFGVFPCADGHVFLLASGIGGNRFWANMVSWLLHEGVRGAEILEREGWGESDFMATDHAKAVFWDIFTAFAADRTKKDLYHDSQKWRVPLGPVNKPSDVLASAQLQDRGYFVDVEAFGRTIAVPGAPYKLSETPWQLGGAAPKLGEHSDEVLSEAGFGAAEIAELRREGVIR
ncbi:MAG: CaiB/BaiF CoA-transferase family protein [Acidimicrobiia bacterium]